MDHVTPPSLASWQNFYVIIGSSAGALTGLQFVVMTLVSQARAAGSVRNIYAFGTPTVVHFCTALLISAGMAAPWLSTESLSGCIAACGVAGCVYSSRVFWHARAADYKPDLEDWIWYLILPLVAHAALLCTAALMWRHNPWSLVAIAADSLMFLLLGVHNSWDTVTFIAIQQAKPGADSHTDDLPINH